MSDQMFKPGYEGVRPSAVLTAPERQTLRQAKPDLVRRLHDAMLTLAAVEGRHSLDISTGGVPSHIVEFADRVGQEAAELPRARFQPTAAQVSAMDPSLKLLEGLLPVYFKVVLLRALHEFARDNGEPGEWPWDAIGGWFGFSERWAEDAYTAAIVQAARRAGILPMKDRDHAVLVVGCWVNRGWLTNISTGPDPRQALSNLKTKIPVRVDEAFAIWVAGPPVAKRIAEAARGKLRATASHGSWYKANPESVADVLVREAQQAAADWMMEEFQVRAAA